jgi:uncharacterized membrane protein
MKRYKIIEYICLFVVVISFVIPGIVYSSLPDEIPTHYGITGYPDTYSDKTNIWLSAVLSLISFIGISRAIKLIKKEVKHPVQKELLVRSLTLLNLGVLIVFFISNIYTIIISFDVTNRLGFWSYISMACLFILPLIPVIENKLKN